MNNTYGNVKPAIIDPAKDVEIFYHYRPTMNSEDPSFKDFKKVNDVTSMLKVASVEADATNSDGDVYPDKTLPGMCHLELPVSIFGRKGFYTIYIKPKEIYATITDVGVLGAYPDIRGIVIDLNDFDRDRALFTNDNLTGYRVEYLEHDGNSLKRQDYYRIITSNSLSEPITQNLVSATTNSNGYRFNQSGTLCFITLSPSTSPSFKATSTPYIGSPNQRIVITNTKFDPVCLRVEVCENDFDTLATSIDGNQIRSLDNGILTTYNSNNEVYKQWEFYSLKDNYNDNAMLEVKKQRKDNIDNTVNPDLVFEN